jgi:hypothetical protein
LIGERRQQEDRHRPNTTGEKAARAVSLAYCQKDHSPESNRNGHNSSQQNKKCDEKLYSCQQNDDAS